ncbi:MAG: SDR family oxidoreductase [Pseudomonadota bacterium]
MQQLDGAKVVIPGGTSGIGLATAQLALEQGAHVVIASRTQERLGHAREVLGDVEGYLCDVTVDSTVEELFKAVGTCDHIFICAAVSGEGQILGDSKPAFAVNMDSRYWGHYNVVRHGAPTISGNGSITFMSGLATHTHFPGAAGRAASQAAIESLASYAAVELSPIRVNTLLPGVVETPALVEFLGENYEIGMKQINSMIPVGRVAQPKEVAELALFVMGCEFMTGSNLLMDGGQLLK